jgi:hypothetical protein
MQLHQVWQQGVCCLHWLLQIVLSLKLQQQAASVLLSA